MRWRWGVAAGLSALITVVLVLAWAGGNVESAGDTASVLGAWTAVAALVLWARQNTAGPQPPTADQLDAAEERLARLVEQAWTREAALRRLADPRPLDVRWTDSSRALADHAAVIGASLHCRADDGTRLAEAFRALPWRRLAILGPAGSGKTTLALLLTLALLRTRRPGDPVPVILSLSSEVLDHPHLRSWLSARLTAEYPALGDGRRMHGVGVAAELLASRRLLPVLDGLDEIPAPHQARVFTMINDHLAEGGPLVLTCRTAAYEQAVTRCRDVLTATAVVEPQPVSLDALIEYLTLGAAPGELDPRWRRLTERLRAAPDGPAATALLNPLNASMVRLVYSGPAGAGAGAGIGSGSGGPEELADSDRFPDAAAITKRLLAGVVPALCDRDSRLAAATPGSRPALDPGQAPRRLAQLAAHLQGRGTYDFQWWQLHQAVPALAGTWRRGLCLGLAAFLCHTAAELVHYWLKWPEDFTLAVVTEPMRVARSLGFGLGVLFLTAVAPLLRRFAPMSRGTATCAALLLGGTAGILHGGLFVLGRHHFLTTAYTSVWGTVSQMAMAVIPYTLTVLAAGPPHPPALPTWGRFGLRGRGRRLAAELASVPLTVLGFALLCNVLPFVFASDPDPLELLGKITENTPPLVLGAFFGTGLALLRFGRAPLVTDGGATPASSLRADRRYGLAVALLCALAFVLHAAMRSAPWQYVGTLDNLTEGVSAAGPKLLAAVVIGALLALSATSWGHFAVARLWLAHRGRLPLRTMAFLEEAHRLGILRRVGPVYQFRHALLQDHLAAQATVPHMRRPPADAPAGAPRP
ncbi:NACHT domain-containing protein [Streptomyces sp. NPDC051211]|uniref:NACHT domain-containing protein n=1 Tax=Streptomyces sp. NPDC051211 TaxID=3154643 RepID=UPI00344FAE03